MNIFKKAKLLITQNKMPQKKPEVSQEPLNLNKVYTQEELNSIEITASVHKNNELITSILGHNADFVKRPFLLGQTEPIESVIFYLDGLINPGILDGEIMAPLLEPHTKYTSGNELLKTLKSGGLISRAEITRSDNLNTILAKILLGEVALFIDGFPEAFLISCKGYKMRSIPEPTIENSVRGPREAFIETLSVNISLIRRRLKTPNLMVEGLQIGKVSQTNIAIIYLKGLASEGLVEEVHKRLGRIDIDVVLESGYLEHFIQDSPFSPFPQVTTTERPDTVVAKLAEGRVAILTDGTPFALVVPGELMSLIQAPEDFYHRFYFSTFTRWIRFFSFFMALTLPALYIAISTFHQEMIPTTLFISVAAARQGVPFPALIEATFMEIAFEVLREAGIHLPGPVGQAVSIVGALVIGQAAVQANIVSPLMVIIVAFTGIASFNVPQYGLGISLRLLRFPLMLAAAFLGLFGVMTFLLSLLLHLCSLRSFSVPYLSPLTPFNFEAAKSALLVAPHWTRYKRNSELVQHNQHRTGKSLEPIPPERQG